MSIDLLIKSGSVVDGNGGPAYEADIAITDGSIVEIGRISRPANQVIDAKGKIVCPGFIDPHTHYDAQVCWDPVLSPSSWHGVTTMVIGNCGVGVAPCRAEQRDMTMWDLTNVEGIPYGLLEAGLSWDWETFPEYMDAIERRRMGVNVAFLAPLAPFRHVVLGEESIERGATPEETNKIAGMLADAMSAGAYGFSSSAVRSHVGYKGRPFASRLTTKDEFKAYCRVLRDAGKGAIEIALLKVPGKIADDEYELLDLLLTESGRKVTFTSVFARDDDRNAHLDTLRKLEPLIERGALPQSTPKPLVSYMNMRNPFNFSHFDCVRPLFNQPEEIQRWVYGSPEFRKAFKAELAKPSVAQNDWSYYLIQEVKNPELKSVEGKTIADVAKESSCDPVDLFFDLAVQDDLDIGYTVTLLNGNDDGVAEIVGDPRVIIALSDGGAHIDALCDASYPTFMLAKWVRDKKVMSVEKAVQRLTSEAADLFGITSRGRLAPGMAADIVVFDLDKVGNDGLPKPVYDLPGGARRVVVNSLGIDYTLVNGQVLFDHGQQTSARSGHILRSGTD